MEIDMKDLLRFVTLAVDAGVQKYMKGVEPAEDRVRQADAKRYIARMGFQPVMLRKWTDAKLLTPVKQGDRQNAPVTYSLAELKAVISSLELKAMCNGQGWGTTVKKPKRPLRGIPGGTTGTPRRHFERSPEAQREKPTEYEYERID